MKVYEVYKVVNGRLVPYERIKSKTRDGVRTYLTENKHRGTFYWATNSEWKKVSGAVNI